MTGAENPSPLSPVLPPDLGGPLVSPDLLPEQASAFRTLDQEQAAELGRLLTERLKGIDVMHAESRDSLSAMRVASLTTSLLTEALTADPEGFSAVSRHRGPIDRMSDAAGRMHQHQTGHSLDEVNFSPTYHDYQRALGVLNAVKQKVEDQRWDGTIHPSSRGADAMTANLRKDVMQSAVRGLGLIAEQRGQALVSPETAEQVIEYLRSK